ncbi:serine hydrolase [Streptomyces sp. NPDC001941]|uniref:serine hydrolase n=1 Tax=Streptomyces sp. NPDC001941 TaxID=3154659 RepID=UPI003328B696
MPTFTRSPRPRGWAVWATTGALLAAPAATARADDAPAKAPAACTAKGDPALAKRLSQELAAALRGRRSTVSVAVHDPRRGLRCRIADDRYYDAASTAKILIMEAALRRAQQDRREPTPYEKKLLKAMITRSDNEAASALWWNMSRDRFRTVLSLAGANDTILGYSRYWGLTRTTARDQLKILSAAARRPYAMRLMSETLRGQSWGVSAGAPRGVTTHLKNGWLARSTHGWRVHSVGTFTGGRSRYSMALLSHDNPSMKYGVDTLERIARAVHRALGDSRATGRDLQPGAAIDTSPDGSGPYEDPAAPAPERAPEPETEGLPRDPDSPARARTAAPEPSTTLQNRSFRGGADRPPRP